MFSWTGPYEMVSDLAVFLELSSYCIKSRSIQLNGVQQVEWEDPRRCYDY